MSNPTAVQVHDLVAKAVEILDGKGGVDWRVPMANTYLAAAHTLLEVEWTRMTAQQNVIAERNSFKIPNVH